MNCELVRVRSDRYKRYTCCRLLTHHKNVINSEHSTLEIFSSFGDFDYADDVADWEIFDYFLTSQVNFPQPYFLISAEHILRNNIVVISARVSKLKTLNRLK